MIRDARTMLTRTERIELACPTCGHFSQAWTGYVRQPEPVQQLVDGPWARPRLHPDEAVLLECDHAFLRVDYGAPDSHAGTWEQYEPMPEHRRWWRA